VNRAHAGVNSKVKTWRLSLPSNSHGGNKLGLGKKVIMMLLADLSWNKDSQNENFWGDLLTRPYSNSN
jgi:hypothetical protein